MRSLDHADTITRAIHEPFAVEAQREARDAVDPGFECLRLEIERFEFGLGVGSLAWSENWKIDAAFNGQRRKQHLASERR